MRDLWAGDQVVLDAVAERCAATDQPVLVDLLWQEIGANEEETQRALRRLLNFGYFEGALSLVGVRHVDRMTEKGLREVGAYPPPDAMAERFLELLTRLADTERDPARRSRWLALRDAAVAVGIGGLGEVIGGAAQAGIGL